MVYRLVGNIEGKPIRFDLQPGANRLGRSSKDVDHALARDTVSRLHARIEVTESGLKIQDCGSHNGTFVNGQRIEVADLRTHDWIRIGDVELQLVERDEPLRESEGVTHPGRDDLSNSGIDSVATFRSDSELDSIHLTWTSTPTGDIGVGAGSDLMRALVDLGSFLVRDEPGRDIAQVCLEHVSRLFPFRLACLLELNPASGEAEVRAHHPASLEPELHVSRTMVDMVVRDRKTLLLRELQPEEELLKTAVQKGIRSAIVTPLMHDNQILGVLYVDRSDPAHGFGSRQRKLVESLANLVAAKIASMRTRNEIEWAAFIQREFLPKSLIHPPGYAVAARLVPSELVGGDLYEALALPDGRYLYVLGDVVGHGMGAALMMSNALATLRSLVGHTKSSLELTKRLHELLTKQLPTECYITMFLAVLDPRTHEVDYVTAGHPPPVLLGAEGETVYLASTALAIAMPIPGPLESERLTLAPGSLLAIWSDGIPEAIQLGSRPMQDFTEERLVERLGRLRHEPLETILDRVFRESDEFVGSPRAQDDRTLLLLRRET